VVCDCCDTELASKDSEENKLHTNKITKIMPGQYTNWVSGLEFMLN